MADKVQNYSDAAIAAILAAIVANGNVADKSVAVALADNPETGEQGHPDVRLDNDGNVRKARSIIAKMRRMADTGDFTYERVKPVTKDGKPVTKKADLVARIASAADVTVAELDGLEKAPKGTLETLLKVVS